MGLDMWMHCNDRELTHEVQDEKWSARRGQIMYWRKANAIHRWFVEEAEYSEGVDDCSEIEVTVDDLKKLHELCKEVLDDHSKAPELLPVKDGFFFGSQEYDEWYFKNIEYTFNTLSKILDLIEPAKPLEVAKGEYSGITFSSDYVYKHNDWILRFTYQASW